MNAVKQANAAELQPIEGLEISLATTPRSRARSTWAARGILVSSHVVGSEMRRMVDEPENRADIDRSLGTSTGRCS